MRAFTIEVDSLDNLGGPGLALNFDPTKARSFPLITADTGILGFDPAAFAIDTTGFQNNLAGGSFSIGKSGNDLLLNFTPVPEPTAWLLLLGGVCLRFATRRRTHGGCLAGV
jgi:hypothetical protein